MKRFLFKILIMFFSFFCLYSLLISFLIITYPKLSSTIFINHDWLRINNRIQSSKTKIKQDTLYVGCSVAGQLLPYNSENQLTSNGSTYPIGNYFLIKNSLNRNSNITDVVYYSVPDIIGHRISRERTYNYFVKPFYTFENKNEILKSKKVRTILEENKLLDLNLFLPYKLLSMSDYNYSDGKPDNLYSLSDESFEWLCKIDSICNIKGVKFHIASPPVPIYKQMESNDWIEIRNKVHNSSLENLFEDYFKSIVYLDEKYLKDHIHWQDSLINKNRLKYINLMKESLK